jgi:tetratricopeptide (TPR) repeat protein
LNVAQDAFGRVNTHDDTPTWASYFDETKLIVDTGIAHGRMEEYDKASRLIEHALQAEDRRHYRPLAFHYFWLATAQLGLGDLDRACQTATSALTLSLNLDSVRTLSHIHDFQGQLAPYRAEKVVHEFEHTAQRAFPV